MKNQIIKAETGKGMSFRNKVNQLHAFEMSGKSNSFSQRALEIGNELNLNETYPCRDIVK